MNAKYPFANFTIIRNLTTLYVTLLSLNHQTVNNDNNNKQLNNNKTNKQQQQRNKQGGSAHQLPTFQTSWSFGLAATVFWEATFVKQVSL